MHREFANRSARLTMAAWSAWIVFVGVAGIVQGSLAGIGFMALGVAALARVMRSFCVIVEDGFVETRYFVAWRRRPLESVAEAEISTRRSPTNLFGREFLVLSLRDGATIEFRLLNAKRREGRTSVVQQAVHCINLHLASA